MNRRTFSKFRTWALTGVALAAIAGPAWAEEARQFQIPQQSLVAALEAFAKQGDKEIIFNRAEAEGHAAGGLSGTYEPAQALAMLLSGSGLKFRQVNDNTFMVEASDPQSGSAAGDGADGTVAALVVTAQKKEEQIQDVPIAISAFTEKSLQEQKIEGGFDLLKAIPNVTFSKNNFTSYNFSIRGIGTKAVSATTDPAVAVSFNNVALLQNRLFEQEYFDVERVEVLRGPQGTLYGRNATAGVINVITAKPNLSEFKGWVKGEVGNYHAKRISAMVNVPLVNDKLAIRFAGALTDRQGYDYNLLTNSAVNGRDLWSGRITVAFNPTDRIRTNLVWERFHEDDNRSRTGKQLCHRDDGPEEVDGLSVLGSDTSPSWIQNPALRRAPFSQGCKPGSLYEDAAFGTPNGLSYNFVLALLSLGDAYNVGFLNDRPQSVIQAHDPYAGTTQSKNLREIASVRNPIYRAGADVVNLNLDFDLTPSVTLSSQTVYNKDHTYSFQDYNRFNTQPIFTDTSSLTIPSWAWNAPRPSFYHDLSPGGVFCDPQLGCSDRMAGFDLAKANGEQVTQELRLQSSFDGPLNFSLGANYTQFRTLVDYYIMFNLMTAMAMTPPLNLQGINYTWNPSGANDHYDPNMCYDSHFAGFLSPFFGDIPLTPVPLSDPRSICPYVDPNPLESMTGEGHNYYRSKNPYRLRSGGVFGELYWNVTPELKLTAGLRYSDDHKHFVPVPSQVLLARGLIAGGVVSKGYPEDPPIKQHWGEWTGRLGVDWKPALSFTNQTLLYAFYSRGFKAGGANPPTPGLATAEQERAQFDPIYFEKNPWFAEYVATNLLPVLQLTGNEYGRTFEPEFVNAFEVGSKNTLLGGGLVLNGDLFFYDYKNYQVSQIRDRTAVNENFDAKAWGAELQTVFSPSHNLQIIGNIGYLDTAIANGETSIDVMNRTQGNPNYVVVKPWAQLPSNCVAPVAIAKEYLSENWVNWGYWRMCGVAFKGALGLNFPLLTDPNLGGIYDPRNYPEIHGGAGILDNLGGNELPNAPHWTVNLGAQYGFDFLEGWRATVRGDAYWQSQSWARVYNSDPYDKLHGWYNVNLSVWVERPEDGLKIELYAKNILDKTPITDSFLNSDDTGLTTNVFVLDPRLIGLSIKKDF